MKFKPGDLVEVDPGVYSLLTSREKHGSQDSPALGVIISAQETQLYMRERDGKPFQTYDVLVNGAVERRIESSLKPIDKQEHDP